MAGRYLVTGGAGFIGSHLAHALLARGDDVTVVDDLSTGRLANIDDIVGHQRFRFVRGSVLDEDLVNELVTDCDVVFHLAAAVGVQLVVEQPLASFDTNVRGAQIIIAAAHRHDRRILVTSSSEVYGKNTAQPVVETADSVLGNPTVNRWAYAISKAVEEVLALTYCAERGLEAVVVRLFNTVGPRQSPSYGMVAPRLVRQALRDEPLTVYGDGGQTRSFCHVRDAVDALCRLIDHPAAVGGVFNIGSPEEVTILELAHRIADRVGSSSRVRLVPYDEAYTGSFEDMRRRVPDISRIQALTGWSPTATLDQILDDIIEEASAETPTR